MEAKLMAASTDRRQRTRWIKSNLPWKMEWERVLQFLCFKIYFDIWLSISILPRILYYKVQHMGNTFWTRILVSRILTVFLLNNKFRHYTFLLLGPELNQKFHIELLFVVNHRTFVEGVWRRYIVLCCRVLMMHWCIQRDIVWGLLSSIGCPQNVWLCGL